MDRGGGKDFSTTCFVIYYIYIYIFIFLIYYKYYIYHIFLIYIYILFFLLWRIPSITLLRLPWLFYLFFLQNRALAADLGRKWGQREGQAGWNCCKTDFVLCLDCPLCGYLWFTDPFHHCQLFLRNWPIFGSMLCVLCTPLIDKTVGLWKIDNRLFEPYLLKSHRKWQRSPKRSPWFTNC